MEDKNIKKVSVVMCTYNGEKYLREQLDSILNQTYPIYEIIIQDDASTDRTWEIILEYELKYEIIKPFKNKTSLSFNVNFYDAVLKTTGDYIAFSDQDDIWLPKKIEVLINILGEKLLALGQDVVLFNDNRKTSTPEIKNKTLEQFFIRSSYPGHAMLFRKSLLEIAKNVMWIELAHDNLFSLIAIYYNSLTITDEVLQIWRRHDNNLTSFYIDDPIEVINIDPQKKKQNKLIFVIKNLIKGKKSMSIEKGFNKYYELFSYLDNYTNSLHPNSKKLVKFAKLMKEQTFLGYIKASFLCFRLRKEMFDFKHYHLKTYYSVFTYVYRFWYDHRFDM
ncbi:MAG: glycosyltransferase [Bacteroidales bacterium]|nr:glycosyltransferase [Bacteroidales bacterium]